MSLETPADLFDLSATRLSREQVLALLVKAKASSERDWALLLVILWHGLRVSEVVSLTRAHFIDGCLRVQRLQPGRPHAVRGSVSTAQPLIEDENELFNERAAVERLLAHSAGEQQEKRVFPISRIQVFRLVRKYGSLAGLPLRLCRPEVLRQSIGKSVRTSRLGMQIQETPAATIRHLGGRPRVTGVDYAEAAKLRIEEKLSYKKIAERLDPEGYSQDRKTAADRIRRGIRRLPHPSHP
jgi:integrase